MVEVRKYERKLYSQVQLMKSFRNSDKIKKEKSMEIEEKRQIILKKQNFFHNYIIACNKVRKGEN